MKERIIELIMQLAISTLIGMLKRHPSTRSIESNLFLTLQRDTTPPLDRLLFAVTQASSQHDPSSEGPSGDA